jgi:hypothetical protein
MNVINDFFTGAVISQLLVFANRPGMGNTVKVVITVIACLIGGTANYVLENGGSLDAAFKKDGIHWGLTVVRVLGSAWAYHEKVLKPIGKDNDGKRTLPE